MPDQTRRPLSPRGRLGRIHGAALGWLHSTPDLIIIGAARSGTTTLVDHLREVLGVLGFPPREVHFYDSARFDLGMGWYRLQFPYRAQRRRAARRAGHTVIGEKSPSYLAHPEAPARVGRTLPEVRLIALLRDPTTRALSHWNLRYRRGEEPRTFAQIVADEESALTGAGGTDQPMAKTSERGQERYLGRGLYLPQLQRWHGQFPREQLLVLQAEPFFADPAPALALVCAHIGLKPVAGTPSHDIHRNRRDRKEPVPEDVLAHLRDLYRPHNAELATYLGQPLDWA